MFRAAGTGCQEPAVLARSIDAVDGAAVAPRVTPMPLSVCWLPRSMTTLPVHWVAHQVVLALPSTAFDGAEPIAVELAVALAPMATFTARGGCEPSWSALTTCTEPVRAVQATAASTATASGHRTRRLARCVRFC